jgi:hypothetical protein
MRVHIVEKRDCEWAVVVKGRHLQPDEIVETHLSEAAARERMQKLNAAQMGRPSAPSIGSRARESGCTCNGFMLPGDVGCPIEGH